ncbi:MAG TPA: FimV/HubP family polar landmark protein, partial [Methylophilaceae bacterium]|nr:FimV/HubP family polar landmark protein [Methylophilaceae bacterium]
EQIVLEPAAEEPAASSELIDFSFDLDQTVSAGADKKAEPELPAASLDIDLSGISLDFEESAPSDLPAPHFEMPAKQADEIFPKVDMAAFGLEENQAAGTALQPSLGGAESESSDVETKLDLVTAYLDMGDTVGARELLDEVLKEGGPGQRRRAQALVESIG